MGYEPGNSGNHLWWEEVDNRHNAYNTDDELCGYLQLHRFGRHTHWSWFQYKDIVMSPGCLQEVRDKQKELFKSRKSGLNVPDKE